MLDCPNGGFGPADHSVCAQRLTGASLAAVTEAFGRMLSSHVIDIKSALERCHGQLVHLNVSAIEFKRANAVLAGRLPSESHFSQVEQLHVSVVVTRADCALQVVEAVAETNSPAVTSCLSVASFVFLCRYVSYWVVFLARIPDLDATVSTAGDDFFGAAESRAAADGIECVDNV